MNFSGNRLWFGILGVLCVILVILLVRVNLGITEVVDNTPEVSAEPTETVSAGLQTNAYPKVNALIEKYYTASTHGSTDTLKEIVDPFTESDEAAATRKSEFIESYQDITCYTEDGADQDTYIVFAYYEIKFPNIDTLVPGLETLIVCTDSEGNLYINKDQSRLSDEMNAQITELMSREDVVALFNSVDEEFAEALRSDENVMSLCEQMGLDVSSVTATATEAVETEEAASATEETTSVVIGDVKTTMAVVYDLTIYESADDSSTAVGTASVGTYLWVDAHLDGGYSYVAQDNLTGYVKTDGLATYELVDEEITGTVNYYTSCSDSAAVAGTITSDSSYYCTLRYSNGWLQILVDGNKVYIKESDLSQ